MVSRRSFTEAMAFSARAFFYADAGQHAEALGLDEDLAFLTFFGTDLFTESVIGTKEPFAVPACGEDSLLHGFRSLVGPALSLLCCPEARRDRRILSHI